MRVNYNKEIICAKTKNAESKTKKKKEAIVSYTVKLTKMTFIT